MMVGCLIVMDWNRTKAYGPFITMQEAEEWLIKQGITADMYEEQEISVMIVEPKDEKLEVI